MAVSVKVDPIDRNVLVDLTQDLSPASRSAAIAEFAIESLDDAEEENTQALGAPQPYDTYVDGAKGVNESQVKPDGVIVYEFKLISEVLTWIDDQLIIASPVKSGRYARSHALFADGNEIQPSDQPPAAAEFVFLNTQPYARKIERGESQSAPEGVYEGIATLAASRFGNIARISFIYRSPATGDVTQWAQTQSARAMARRHHRVSHPETWLSNQPAIIITPY